MYGAIPYLASAFGIDRNESFRIVCEWIDAQVALAGEPAVPKSVIPAERAAAPTLFDPVPAGKPKAPSRKASVTQQQRKPVKQRASSPAVQERSVVAQARKSVAAAPKKPAVPKKPRAAPKKPVAAAAKKSGPPSDFRAA